MACFLVELFLCILSPELADVDENISACNACLSSAALDSNRGEEEQSRVHVSPILRGVLAVFMEIMIDILIHDQCYRLLEILHQATDKVCS